MIFSELSLLGAFVSAITLLVALVLLDAGSFFGRTRFLLHWSASCGLAAVASVIFAFRGTVPDEVVILGGNPLAILATVLFWAGARELHHQPAHRGWIVGPVLAWVLACAVPVFYESFAARIVLISLLLAFGNGAAALTLWRPVADRGGVRAQRWLGTAAIIVALLHLLRAAGVLAGLSPASFMQPLYLASSLLFVAIGYAGLTATYSQAVRRAAMQFAEVESRDARLRAEAADREAAALRAGQRDMQRLHNGLPAMISLWDVTPDGRFQLIYRGGDALGVTGWPLEELNRLGHYDHLAEPGRAPLAQGIRTAAAEGMAKAEWRLRQPDGSWRWLRCVFQQLACYPDGSSQVVAHAINITAEREAAAEAEAARAELDYTLAHAPLAVFRAVLGADNRWVRTFVSRGIEVISGWPVSEMARAGAISDKMGPEWHAQFAEIGAALRLHGHHKVEARMRHAAGHWIWVRFQGNVAERLPDGSLALVGFITDITAERRAEAREAMGSRLASLGELAAGLAHELKQPLTTMALASENTQRALSRGDVAAALRRLERLDEQVLRAGNLIEHLRRFARGNDANDEAGPMALDLAVSGALVLVGAALRDAGVEVEVALGTPAPVALGHQLALEQVLVNLLLNARDALLEQPFEVRHLRISASQDLAGGRVFLTVADNGGGIPGEVLGRLFEPFVTTKAADRGTGLGLSICQTMIRAMQGSISARNEGGGAVFTVELPAAERSCPPEHLALGVG